MIYLGSGARMQTGVPLLTLAPAIEAMTRYDRIFQSASADRRKLALWMGSISLDLSLRVHECCDASDVFTGFEAENIFWPSAKLVSHSTNY